MIAKELKLNLMNGMQPKTEEELTAEIIDNIEKLEYRYRLLQTEASNMERKIEEQRKAHSLDKKIQDDTANMTPWEKQRYYDSWAGGFS